MSSKIQVLHISAECYPAAKSGGLGDVVGALPKYLNQQDAKARVIIPRYDLEWINKQKWKNIFTGAVWMGYYEQPFQIQQLEGDFLGFDLLVVKMPGKFDRPGIYSDPYGNPYGDEVERFVSFQKSVLRWIQNTEYKPDVLHCHDHHTGMIPFFVKFCPEFQDLLHVPTIFTIHNGKYHGSFGWDLRYLLPHFDSWVGGLIEWDGRINPLATGIKCCWKLTTVSNAYMDELRTDSNGLEVLLDAERGKSLGILNGIDVNVWDPASDAALTFKLKKSVANFKRENKKPLISTYGLDQNLPLVSFIGRFAIEKGADILPDLVFQALSKDFPVNILILGSGDPGIQHALNGLRDRFRGRYNTYIGYNEGLAHQIYAGSDFLLMPSRVEPCGLNQMYAMRYGTIPIVRRTGGLRDSVVDIGDPDGNGIMFNHVWTGDILHALHRAVELYQDSKAMKAISAANMKLDFSWEKSAQAYLKLYKDVKSQVI